MKRNVSKILVLALLLSIVIGALASCGIVVSGDFRLGIANVETEKAQVAAAVILDSKDRIALVRIDELENGKTASKKDLGNKYNMKSSSKISAEWFEQIDYLEHELVGKTAEEIAGLKADDADITAGCTVYVGNYLAAVVKAMENAKDKDAFRGTVDNLALTLNFIAGAAGADGVYTVGISAVALNRGYVMAKESKFLGAIPADCRLGVASIKTDEGRVAAAVVVDSNNRIILVKIDEYQNGKSDSKRNLCSITDNEGKNGYGMYHKEEECPYPGYCWYSHLAEWDEQIAHLESTLIGKNAEQVEIAKGGKTDGDADIIAGCTVGIDNYTKAVIKAIDDAKASKSFSAIADDLNLTFKMNITTEGEAVEITVDAEVTDKNTKVAGKTLDAAAPEQQLSFGFASVSGGNAKQSAASVVVDAQGRILFVRIDEIDVSSGNLTSKKVLCSITDNEGKNGYGMYHNEEECPYPGYCWYSHLAEWDEQIAFFENLLIGKNAAEVTAIAVESGYPTDADVLAGCTVAIATYKQAVIEAIAAATESNAPSAFGSPSDAILSLSLTATAGSTSVTVNAAASFELDGEIVASVSENATKTLS